MPIELTDEDWWSIRNVIPDNCTDTLIQAERGAIYRAGLAAGIERAAKVCDSPRMIDYADGTQGWNRACLRCAAAIRALLKPLP